MTKRTNTSGELRDFLSSSIRMVANGTMAIDKAREITKLSKQITDSVYAECRLAKVNIELGRSVAEFGKVDLGATEEEPGE